MPYFDYSYQLQLSIEKGQKNWGKLKLNQSKQNSERQKVYKN